jgi:hypothetical protein
MNTPALARRHEQRDQHEDRYCNERNTAWYVLDRICRHGPKPPPSMARKSVPHPSAVLQTNGVMP